MIPRVMINADDFGWTDGHNQAVAQAYASGVLKRASLMSNGWAFDDAVSLSTQLSNLEVGVHLTLNEGAPVLHTRHLPNLTRSDGMFHDTLKALILLMVTGKLLSTEVLFEWRAQIERVLEFNIRISHLDSHKHVHMLPPLLNSIMTLAHEFHIPYIRLPLEDLMSVLRRRGILGLAIWVLARRARPLLKAAGLNFSDHFIGLAVSGAMVASQLTRAINNVKPGITEIMMHPAVITPSVMRLQHRYRWAEKYRFEEELSALCVLKAN